MTVSFVTAVVFLANHIPDLRDYPIFLRCCNGLMVPKTAHVRKLSLGDGEGLSENHWLGLYQLAHEEAIDHPPVINSENSGMIADGEWLHNTQWRSLIENPHPPLLNRCYWKKQDGTTRTSGCIKQCFFYRLAAISLMFAVRTQSAESFIIIYNITKWVRSGSAWL